MGIETLAAVGLVGNIVQFIHFGCSLMSEGRQIYLSSTGLTEENTDIDAITKDLTHFIRTFEKAPRENADLATLAVRCKKIAFELSAAITSLVKQHDGKSRFSKFDSLRQALRSAWKREYIENLRNKLESYRDQLMLHLVSKTGDLQAQTLSVLGELREENVRRDYSITSQIRNMSAKISSIEEGLPSCYDYLPLNELRQKFSIFSNNLQSLSNCHTILCSLQFESMGVRYGAIAESYKKTFDWVFNTHVLPQSDPRSAIKLASWMRHGEGIYWISGKPGSGKSTFMKYLDDNRSTHTALQEWAGSNTLVRASFYFWNAGTSMQKSLQGLLQSLLFTILKQRPDMISILCPDRWNHAQDSETTSKPWTKVELLHTFEKLKEIKLTRIPVNCYLHIDGLDEYSGNHLEVIEVLKNIALLPNVKLCVSSRPWSCFEMAFGRCNDRKLYLQDLTREDIQLYARERLQHDLDLLGVARMSDDQRYEAFITEIVDTAQGVFLWVVLVVRSLCIGIMNEDTISLLQKRLRTLPTELEPFFELILNSVDKTYQVPMAKAFLIALDAPYPLKLIHYSFLDEEDQDPQYCKQLPFKPYTNEELKFKALQTQRRINNRYKGLLESSNNGKGRFGNETVDFLHRTLRDFLEQSEIMKTFISRAPQEFDPYAEITWLLIAEAKFVHHCDKQAVLASAIGSIQKYSRRSGDRCKEEFAIYDHIDLAWGKVGGNIRTLAKESGQGCLMLRNAIHLGRYDYVEHRILSRESLGDIDSVLRHMLCGVRAPNQNFQDSLGWADDRGSCAFSIYANAMSTAQTNRYPDSLLPPSSVVAAILKLGASPNAKTKNGTIWGEFLRWLLEKARVEVANENFHKVFCLLLEHGADVNYYQYWMQLWRTTNLINTNDENIAQGATRLFRTLLEYKLDPNHIFNGNSLWSSFLRLSSLIFPFQRRAQWRKCLMGVFLSRGANLNQIFQDDASGTCWFTTMLSHIRDIQPCADHDLTLDFDVMFKHGLEPNKQISSQTIWEHVLDAILDGFIRQKQYVDAHWTTMIIVLFLRYGANPTCPKLERLINLTSNGKPVLGDLGLRIVRDVLDKELDHFNSRYMESPRMSYATIATPLCSTHPQQLGPSVNTERRSLKRQRDGESADRERRAPKGPRIAMFRHARRRN